MKVKQVLMSAALVISPVALAQGAPAVPPQSSGQRASGESESLKRLVPNNPEQFAQGLHRGNERELRLARLAEQRAGTPKVKELGRMLAEQHGQADQKLMTLANTQKWNLRKEVKPTDKAAKAIHTSKKAEEAKLEQLDGSLFDTAYLTAMVASHDLNVAKVTLAAQQFKGTAFGRELDQLLPILKQHRDQAYQLLGELKQGQPGVGGAGMDGEGSLEQPVEPMEDQMGKDDPGLPAEESNPLP